MRGRNLCVVAVVLCLVGSLQAGVVFNDGFELGSMGNWTTISGATPLDISNAQNRIPIAGTYSAYMNISTDGMYHNISELSGASTATFWLYDGAQTRAYGEVRAYPGEGYGLGGNIVQLFAVGKYTNMDSAKYQARVLAGTGTIGWFNLSDGPSRSSGWHQFIIERLSDDTTINLYVDGMMAKTITGTTAASWDSVVITSARAGTTAGDAYFDGIEITDGLIPEPGTLSVLALGALGLLARRRA